MIIVKHFLVSVESLARAPFLLPSTDELRPVCCPGCGHPSQEPGQPLGIVGHGTYERQVLGLLKRGGQLLIRVRRYLCRGCLLTISVLPDELYPRRWYAAVAVILVLVKHYVEGICAEALRCEVGPRSGDGDYAWSQPRRWGRALLDRLWPKFRRRLGFRGAAADHAAVTKRLRRLLLHHEVSDGSSEPEIIDMVPKLAKVEFPPPRERGAKRVR